LLTFSGLPASAGRSRRVRRLVDRNVVFLLHPLDELFDQFVELPVGGHLLDLFPQVLVEHLPVHQRLLDGALEFVERLLALGQLVPHGLLKPALQQVVRERAEQIFHAHLARGVWHVFGIANAFHESF
jgi:hypothetical protein